MPLIQIIDDDVILLASIGLQLEDAGFTVIKNSDLTHAEQSYAEERPDLVLLEVRSERDHGWDLLARMADTTPVIVLSAASREEDVVRGFAAGAVDYIPKPYRSVELLARIRARLAQPAPSGESPMTLPPPRSKTSDPATDLPHMVAPTPKVGTTERLADSRPPTPSSRKTSARRDSDDELVFMTDAEEMALLRIPESRPKPPVGVEPPPLDENASLGQRLRNERLHRHLTLVQVENELKIRMSYLQALEDEKYTLLPRGSVALQMLRTYVTFLGMNADPIVEEFRTQHYVDQHEPLPALGGSPVPQTLSPWIIWVVAIVLAIAVAVGAILFFDPGFFQNLWFQILRLFPQAA